MTTDDKKNRWRLVIFQALATLFLVGSNLGWGPMQLILETNENYADKCTKKERQEGIVCDEQTSSLLTIGLMIAGTALLSPLLGYLLDRVGPKNLVAAMALIGMTGFAVGIVAIGWHVDPLLYITFFLLALCTWMGSLLIVQLGFHFQGHMASRVIFSLNTLFDSGVLTYLALWFVQDKTGTNPVNVWVGYMVIAGITYTGLVYYWRVAKKEEPDQVSTPPPDDESEDDPEDIEVSTNQAMMDKKVNTDTNGNNSVTKDDSPPLPQYVIVADRGPWQQLTSPYFLLLLLFFGIQCSANNWEMTTKRDFLAHLGDDEKDHLYLLMFTLLTPLSVLASPLIDQVILKYGWMAALQGINVLGIAYTLVKVVSDDLNVQFIGFLFFSLYRGFLFGVSYSFVPQVVSGPVIGRAVGIMNAISGAALFLTIPLARMAIKNDGGDFIVPNTMYVILNIPAILAVVGMAVYCQKEKEAKEAQ